MLPLILDMWLWTLAHLFVCLSIHLAGWLDMRPGWLALSIYAGWLGLRHGWMAQKDIHRENLPILQDFVPYRGRCPASQRKLWANIEKQGMGTADHLIPLSDWFCLCLED